MMIGDEMKRNLITYSTCSTCSVCSTRSICSTCSVCSTYTQTYIHAVYAIHTYIHTCPYTYSPQTLQSYTPSLASYLWTERTPWSCSPVRPLPANRQKYVNLFANQGTVNRWEWWNCSPKYWVRWTRRLLDWRPLDRIRIYRVGMGK